MRSLLVFTLLTLPFNFASSYPIYAQESASATSINRQTTSLVDSAKNYLQLKGQAADGSFSNSIGVTGVVAAGLTINGIDQSDPILKRALAFMENNVQPDGGIYEANSRHANYETCIVAMAFAGANDNGQYDELLKNADRFIRKEQWDETEGIGEDDLKYGGAGYGSSARPDLSNTAFMVEALKTLGAKDDDPAIQRALLFITRCQNLESAANSSPFAAKIDDGGFYYTVAEGGGSPAGETDNGGLRSYPAMTYAGLKSMIYAGLTDDDTRVAAAKNYLKSNYSVDENPGLGKAGLYYYYQTMSKALKANGADVFVADDGDHDWRAELLAKLKTEQQEDGSWVNADKRWMETDPNLVTGYSLLTLGAINK